LLQALDTSDPNRRTTGASPISPGQTTLLVTNDAAIWLTVYDGPELPGDRVGVVYTWNGYADSADAKSLLRYVDQHGERLRRTYLALVHELGETVIGGRSVIEHLDLGRGTSFWWLTLLAEKSVFKSPRIADCLRLLALEEIVATTGCRNLRLVSGDRPLARAVRGLCVSRSIVFDWRRRRVRDLRTWRRRLFDGLPFVAQGALHIVRHAISRWPLRAARPSVWHASPGAITLVSYFFALDRVAAAAGRFSQRQWEALPALLTRAGIRTNFLHHFLYSPHIPNTRDAVDLIGRFNRHQEGASSHALLDAALTPGVLLQVFRLWVHLLRASVRLRDIRFHCTPNGAQVSLWPLLRADWFSSIVGFAAVSNLMMVVLFDRVLSSMPRQQLGLYLCENQAWERALIAAWRAHDHGELVAVQHSSVRFWDLRYWEDPRTVRARGSLRIPLPSRVAVNGRVARAAFEASGYEKGELVDVEALRYLHLCGGRHHRPPGPDSARNVLIIGDFRAAATLRLINCVDDAVRSTRPATACRFVLKCHPAGRVDPSGLPGTLVHVSERPLPELIAESDVVFSSNTTSGGLDAYFAGVAVIVFLSGEDLNLSPLNGVPGVHFVSDGAELAAALERSDSRARLPDVHIPAASPADDFFWLDPALPRWRGLLADAGLTLREDPEIAGTEVGGGS
jgi:surface carbohydrate biosynthesis protein (TIGR04326 family)